MNAHEYAFVAVATIGSIAAVAVVTARNVVHAALYLVVTLAAVGITFLLLGAEFVGWVQILIYVGAIVILFLFGLMLTKAPIGRAAPTVIIHSAFSMRGQGVPRRLIRSTVSSTFIAPSIAVPMISPSPIA